MQAGTWDAPREEGGQQEPGSSSEPDGSAVCRSPFPATGSSHDIHVLPLRPGLAQQPAVQVPHVASEGQDKVAGWAVGWIRVTQVPGEPESVPSGFAPVISPEAQGQELVCRAQATSTCKHPLFLLALHPHSSSTLRKPGLAARRPPLRSAVQPEASPPSAAPPHSLPSEPTGCSAASKSPL